MSVSKTDVEYQWGLCSSLLSPSTASALLKPTGRKGEYKKSDYVSAIAKIRAFCHHKNSLDVHLNAKDIWNALDAPERYRLSFYTPCLAKPIDELNEKEQKNIFSSPDWIFTEKHRGIRVTVIIYNSNLYIYSRNYSDDCSLIDYSNKVFQKADYKGIYAADAMMVINDSIDISDDLRKLNIETQTRPEQILGLFNTSYCVSIQKRTKEQTGADLISFKLITPLYFNGTDYLKRQLRESMSVYDEALRAGQRAGLNLEPIRRCTGTSEAEKRVFLKSLLDNNSEGVVAQNKNGFYDTTDRRNKQSYIKIKRVAGTNMSDTIDTFITGFKDNKLELSVYVETETGTHRCVIAWIRKPKRLDVSVLTTGLVVEVSGQYINSSRMLVKPKFVKVRHDKSYVDCAYTSEFLKSQSKPGFYY